MILKTFARHPPSSCLTLTSTDTVGLDPGIYSLFNFLIEFFFDFNIFRFAQAANRATKYDCAYLVITHLREESLKDLSDAYNNAFAFGITCLAITRKAPFLPDFFNVASASFYVGGYQWPPGS